LNLRFEHLKTGGGKDQSQPLSLREEELKGIIQLSVEGLPTEVDSDIVAMNTENLLSGKLKLFYNTEELLCSIFVCYILFSNILSYESALIFQIMIY